MAARGPKSDKFWAEAIRMAVMRDVEINGQKLKRLRIVADKIVEMAMDGDIQAMKEIGDRLDGRPKQQVEHSGDAENPVMVDSPRAKLAEFLARSEVAG